MIPPVRMPSIRTAAAEARRVALRFPLVLVAGAAAAAAGSLMLGAGNASRFEPALVTATLLVRRAAAGEVSDAEFDS